MAHKMSVPCPLCGAVPAIGSGARQAVAATAKHIAVEHAYLTGEEREALARRLPPPRHFVDALMLANADAFSRPGGARRV